MYGEHSNRGLEEIKTLNVKFLKDAFPNVGEVKWDLELYEYHLLVEKGIECSLITKECGCQLLTTVNDLLSGNIQNSEHSQVYRSEKGKIPKHHFVIEMEAYICSSLEIELDEPTSYQKALASPMKEK